MNLNKLKLQYNKIINNTESAILKDIFSVLSSFFCRYMCRNKVEIKGNNLYNKYLNKYKFMGWGNSISITSSVCRNVKFLIGGTNNQIIIGKGSKLNGTIFEVSGHNTRVIIGENVTLKNDVLHVGDYGSSIIIKANSDIGENSNLLALESTNLVIGEDCMFSIGIYMSTSDAHSIINEKNERINPAKDIVIGNHVWFGERVSCMKGVQLPDNCTVGAETVLTDKEYDSNSIYAGNPVRKIKSNVNWLRERV